MKIVYLFTMLLFVGCASSTYTCNKYPTGQCRSVKDVYKAIFYVQDIDKSLETLALGIILEYVNNRTLEDCQDVNGLKKEILKGIRDAAQGWGLKIERVYITDLDKARNIRLIGGLNGSGV